MNRLKEIIAHEMAIQASVEELKQEISIGLLKQTRCREHLLSMAP